MLIFQQQVIKCDSSTLLNGVLDVSELAAESDGVALCS